MSFTVPGILLTGDHASRPAANASGLGKGSLYACSTHSLIYQTDGSSWSTWATLGTAGAYVSGGTDVAVADGGTGASNAAGARTNLGLVIGTDVQAFDSDIPTVAASQAEMEAGTEAALRSMSPLRVAQAIAALETGGGGGAVDSVADMFGTPDTAFEFGSSSLSGLTALSPTPDVEAAHTIVPGHYFVQDNASSLAWCGRYAAAPSAPFTAITKISDGNMRADHHRAALFIGQSTPGTMDCLEWGASGRTVALETFTPTSYSGTVASGSIFERTPVYLAIVVNSSTDVDYLRSYDGYIWRWVAEARNPGITIGSVGIAMKHENGSEHSAAAFDYLRIWTSAKTFRGV